MDIYGECLNELSFICNKLPDSIITLACGEGRTPESRVCGEACLGGAKERCGADVLMRRDVWTVCGAACRCIGLMYED